MRRFRPNKARSIRKAKRQLGQTHVRNKTRTMFRGGIRL